MPGTETVLTEKAETTAAETKTETKTETTATETKAPEGQTKTETKVEGKSQSKTEPEKYELKQAEGSKLTKEEFGKLTAQAVERGFSKAQAELLVEQAEGSISSYVQREVEGVKNSAAKWLEELKADKTYGGDKLSETVENAKRVVDKYAEPEFKDFLRSSGLGNHPMVVRMFAKLGQSFGEDHFKDGSPVTTKKEKSAAEIMYDKTK